MNHEHDVVYALSIGTIDWKNGRTEGRIHDGWMASKAAEGC